MTRRKGEITFAQIRRCWPHHVVLLADKVKGIKNFDTVHGFANTLSVAPRTGGSIHRNDTHYWVFCFLKEEDARKFAGRFGGEYRRYER
jgi:hypothetical protein